MADEPTNEPTPTNEPEQTTPDTTDDTATTTEDTTQAPEAPVESKSTQRRKAATAKPAADKVLGDEPAFDAVAHGQATAERNVAKEQAANR